MLFGLFFVVFKVLSVLFSSYICRASQIILDSLL
ncbi:hypothetical protein CTO_0962 [Chlamydia trachomatis A2497]|uniref:Uncharacterized protein n=1 Tax=Chlamydia trachomatis serovar A (strain A2497) TaxID=580047 RepID=G4NP63_CHLT4|nr:hypothetical protein CTO_0962 [Chlamydia trachomatis A2497]